MTHPDGDILDDLARVFAASAQRRLKRAATAWALLRPYERRLVKEAAVMGYVLGERAGRVTASGVRQQMGRPEPAFPADADILRQVIEHCDATSNTYPYLADACSGRRRRVTRKRMWPGEAQQAEGSR